MTTIRLRRPLSTIGREPIITIGLLRHLHLSEQENRTKEARDLCSTNPKPNRRRKH